MTGLAGAWGAAAEARLPPLAGRTVQHELIERLVAQGPVVPVAVAASGLLVMASAWSTAPRALVAAWCAALVLQEVARGIVLGRVARATAAPLRRRLAAVCALMAAAGVVHGASLLLWEHLDTTARALLSLALLGLVSGSVATLMGWLPLFACYAMPVLGALAVAWARWLTPHGAWWWSSTTLKIAVLFSVFFGVLSMVARETFALHQRSLETRQRLAQALVEAEAASHAKTRFLASASHDLRQPIHTMTLFGAALATRPLPEELRPIVGAMNQALQALAAQLDTLLDISKLDAGVVANAPRPIALAPLLERLRAEFEPAGARRRLTLRVDVARGADHVDADPALLERVLRNLLDNAIKYTERGGVVVGAQPRPDGRVALRVADTGIGIAPADQARVFEEFVQVGNPERDRTRGLGLGLAIVRRLVGLMQADLTLDSTPGRGTTLTLLLPATTAAVRTSHGAPAVARASLAGRHLLVVDDEEPVRIGMATLLGGLGCSVDLATGTAEALACAARRRPDVVLADFRLRGDDDGLHAIGALRKRDPGLPALLISGDTAPGRLRQAESAGVPLLHKPVDVDTLVAAIDRAVRQAPRGAPPRA